MVDPAPAAPAAAPEPRKPAEAMEPAAPQPQPQPGARRPAGLAMTGMASLAVTLLMRVRRKR